MLYTFTETPENTWLKVYIKISKKHKGYNSGTATIMNREKEKILPMIRLPNILFTNVDKVDSIDELNLLREFNIYFRNFQSPKINVHVSGLPVKDIRVDAVDVEEVTKNMSIHRLKKLHDFTYINYYLSNAPVSMDRRIATTIQSNTRLFFNPNLFERYLKGIDIDIKSKKRYKKGINVLYLVDNIIQYEKTDYTNRTQQMLRLAKRQGLEIIVASRYGYPYEKPVSYYDDMGLRDKTLEGIKYMKILDGSDNINTNNLIDYIQKYIYQTIRVALKNGINVIHGVNGFWNGVVAYCAARFLGIKSVYEVREIFEDALLKKKPEIYMSDYLRMRKGMEVTIMQNVNTVIAKTPTIREKLIKWKIDPDKIKVITNGYDIDSYFRELRFDSTMRRRYQKSDFDLTIGYIKKNTTVEDVRYLFESLNRSMRETNTLIKLMIFGEVKDADRLDELLRVNRINVNLIEIVNKEMEYQKLMNTYFFIDLFVFAGITYLPDSIAFNKLLYDLMVLEKVIVAPYDKEWRKLIIHQTNGMIIQDDSVPSLSKTISNFARNKKDVEVMGRKAHKWIKDNKTWKSAGDALTRVYNKLYNDHKRKI